MSGAEIKIEIHINPGQLFVRLSDTVSDRLSGQPGVLSLLFFGRKWLKKIEIYINPERITLSDKRHTIASSGISMSGDI